MRQRRQMRDARRRRRPSLCHSLSLSLSLSLSRARFRKERNKRASNSWYVFMPSSFKRKFKKRIFASKTLNHNKQKKRGRFLYLIFCSFGGRASSVIPLSVNKHGTNANKTCHVRRGVSPARCPTRRGAKTRGASFLRESHRWGRSRDVGRVCMLCKSATNR